MQHQTRDSIRAGLSNASRREGTDMTFPVDLAEVDWAGSDLIGWRDRKAPLQGYLVLEDTDASGAVTGTVTVRLTAAESSMSAARSAMCLLCGTVRKANEISLFTARRTGAAGRQGNTVGTYMCADLRCAAQLRRHPLFQGGTLADHEVAVRRVEMLERVRAFVADVRRP